MRGEEGQSRCREQLGLSQEECVRCSRGTGRPAQPRPDSDCRRAEQIFRSGNHVIRRTRLLINLIEFYFNLSMESNSFGLGRGF